MVTKSSGVVALVYDHTSEGLNIKKIVNYNDLIATEKFVISEMGMV